MQSIFWTLATGIDHPSYVIPRAGNFTESKSRVSIFQIPSGVWLPEILVSDINQYLSISGLFLVLLIRWHVSVSWDHTQWMHMLRGNFTVHIHKNKNLKPESWISIKYWSQHYFKTHRWGSSLHCAIMVMLFCFCCLTLVFVFGRKAGPLRPNFGFW